MVDKGMYCRKCSYDLRGQAEPRCPECGRGFDPADPRTYRRRPRNTAWVWVRRLVLLVLLVALGLGTWFYLWRAGKIRDYEREQEALKELTAAGAVPKQQYIVDAPEWLDKRLGRPQWLRRETSVFMSRKQYQRASEFAPLHSLKHLQVLKLATESSMTIDALQGLRGLNELRTLSLPWLSLPADPLRDIRVSSMSKLECLYVTEAPVREEGLAELASIESLTELDLNGEKLTSGSITHLSKLSKLKYLSLSGQKAINDDSLAHLQGLQNLRQLWLSGTSITDRGIAALKGLPRIEYLCLYDTRITDACIPDLIQMKQLRTIIVPSRSTSDFGLSKEAVSTLKRMCPRLSVVHL